MPYQLGDLPIPYKTKPLLGGEGVEDVAASCRSVRRERLRPSPRGDAIGIGAIEAARHQRRQHTTIILRSSTKRHAATTRRIAGTTSSATGARSRDSGRACRTCSTRSRIRQKAPRECRHRSSTTRFLMRASSRRAGTGSAGYPGACRRWTTWGRPGCRRAVAVAGTDEVQAGRSHSQRTRCFPRCHPPVTFDRDDSAGVVVTRDNALDR